MNSFFESEIEEQNIDHPKDRKVMFRFQFKRQVKDKN